MSSIIQKFQAFNCKIFRKIVKKYDSNSVFMRNFVQKKMIYFE